MICVPYLFQNGLLHLGHGYAFTRGDAIARYKRICGFNVLFPFAWLWDELRSRGLSDKDIEKIAYLNSMRVIRANAVRVVNPQIHA